MKGIIIKGYNLDEGHVQEDCLPQFFGVNYGGQHYLVSEGDLVRAATRGCVVGRLGNGGRVVDKVYLPDRVYLLESYNPQTCEARAVSDRDIRLIIEVMREKKRLMDKQEFVVDEPLGIPSNVRELSSVVA